MCRVREAQNYEVEKEVSGLIQYYSLLIATRLVGKMPLIAKGAHQVCAPPPHFLAGINLFFHSWSHAGPKPLVHTRLGVADPFSPTLLADQSGHFFLNERELRYC